MEIPHFGSMRGKERELIVLRSENGETWKEHQYDSRHENLTEILNGMNEGIYALLLFWPGQIASRNVLGWFLND